MNEDKNSLKRTFSKRKKHLSLVYLKGNYAVEINIHVKRKAFSCFSNIVVDG